MPEFAIRICCKESEAIEHAKKITTSFDSIKYFWCFEKGEQTEQEHIHGYILTDKEFKNDKAKQRFMNKLGYKGNGVYSCNYVKDTELYFQYIMKEDKHIYHNLSDKDYTFYKNKVKEVKQSKKGTLIQKVEIFVKQNKLSTDTLYNCQLAVMKFWLHINGFPHTKTIFLYVSNLLYSRSNNKSAAELMADCFGIEQDKAERLKTKADTLLDKAEHLENRHNQLLKELEEMTISNSEDNIKDYDL